MGTAVAMCGGWWTVRHVAKMSEAIDEVKPPPIYLLTTVESQVHEGELNPIEWKCRGGLCRGENVGARAAFKAWDGSGEPESLVLFLHGLFRDVLIPLGPRVRALPAYFVFELTPELQEVITPGQSGSPLLGKFGSEWRVVGLFSQVITLKPAWKSEATVLGIAFRVPACGTF